MTGTSKDVASILAGVDDIIDGELGFTGAGELPLHVRSGSCKQLSETPLPNFDATALLTKVYSKIANNMDGRKPRSESTKIWRYKKQKGVNKDNESSEVRLERVIITIPIEIWPDSDNWVNQVPVASGIRDSRSDRGRHVDLVHKIRDGEYELIELKVATNTPLFAAMEILKYGLLYLYCREDERVSSYIRRNHPGGLLDAKKIHLIVLAPPKYYGEYDLAWLEEALTTGLSEFSAQRRIDFEIDFKFEELRLALSRSPVSWRDSRTG